MAPEDERLAANRTIVRAANDGIERTIHDGPSLHEYLCECGGMKCRETIRLRADEYRRVRSEPTSFVVAPGHDLHVDEVAHEFERFTLIRKTARPRALVE
jgi:hypothetical protein